MTIQSNDSNRCCLAALALLGILALPSALADNYQTCKKAYEESPAATDGFGCAWHWTKEDGYDSTGQLTCEVYVKCPKCQNGDWGGTFCVGWGWGTNNCQHNAQGWFRGHESQMKEVFPFCYEGHAYGNSRTDVWLRPRGWTGS